MKKRLFFFCAFFVVFGLAARGQVYTMTNQGFEANETPHYRVIPANAAVTTSTVYVSGERSIHLLQQTSDEVEFYLDTLDFTQNTSLRYIALYFDHICHIPLNSSTDLGMAKIYWKRVNQTEWTQVTGQDYDRTGDEFSTEFSNVGAFSMESYPAWANSASSAVSNTMWKSERFNLNTAISSSVAQSDRKLLIKFVLKRRTLSGAIDTNKVGWWLDNIKVNASADPMVTPKLTMELYPDGYYHPSSRGARIELTATTPVTLGINPDSVYIRYKAGSSPTIHRVSMSPKPGVANRYVGIIPFWGYDTVMQFNCVIRDATSNANMLTFPKLDDSWISYVCVRGSAQPGIQTPELTGTQNTSDFPMPNMSDARSEFVYDSALLANAGYKAGAITSLRYTLGATTTNQNRPRFQIKMCNMPTSYSRTYYYNMPFYLDYMHAVYDSAYSVGMMSAGNNLTIQLQDTFYYAGKDILMQITYDCSSDPSATSIKTISTPSTKPTIYRAVNANLNYHPFTDGKLDKAASSSDRRPAFVFNEIVNLPLLFDAGISALVSPNYDIPMMVRPGSLTVKLKNYGALPFNGVRVSYSIDDTVTGYYDWNGTLNGSETPNGGQEVQLVIADDISMPAGYHVLKVWVEDTLTVASQLYRDHEPWNDTLTSSFIICDGPMSGVKNIGGSNPHFNTINEFLMSLSRCGIDDSLIVRLAPGEHQGFIMPTVSGLSDQHYIVFESQSDTQAVIYPDSINSPTAIVDLEATGNIRFRNLKFVRTNAAHLLTDMVTIGMTSHNCSFEGCSFIDSVINPTVAGRIGSMINSGYSNNLYIDSCTFIGGRIGVDLKGQASDIRSSNNVVRRSLFRNQNEYALRVENQTNVTVDDNELYDVLVNSGYVLLLTECYGTTSLQRNRVYTSHGAGAVVVNNVMGTSDNHALVANNMVVCHDDGTANLMRTAFNIIQGDYIDVLYNSVKMIAPDRVNIAAATFGGGVLTNSCFMNNIVVTLDDYNYAFAYLPLTSTSNIVKNNVYYSLSPVMNRKGTTAYSSVSAWSSAVPEDTASISINPNFLNGSQVDLRTYNRAIKGVAIPVASVPTDMYGNPRDTVGPCVGAFEFASLEYDFGPESMPSPVAEDCYMPDSVEMVLVMRNSGVNSYTYSSTHPIVINYQVNDDSVQSFHIIQTVPAEDTVTVHTGQMLHLPANGLNDSIYIIRVWSYYQDDPNPTNDTNVFQVISRYHPAAPDDDTVWTNFGYPATIIPTAGIDQWSVYNDTTAPLRQSRIYWYYDPTDATPFHEGPEYTTVPLRGERNYYIRQRRLLPIVRFTQIELMRETTTEGLTDPMPYWMQSGRKAAVQLTNVGDATAYLQGDTLMTVSPTSNINNKVYVFGNVKIEPGQSLVIQYGVTGASDSSVTLRTNVLSNKINATANIAFVYKHGGRIEDAVPFNNVVSANSTQAIKWSTLGVPSYVWSDSVGVPIQTTSAGAIRVGFNGDSTDWVLATASNPMFLGSNRSEWIRYTDRGCEGELGTITVSMVGQPTAELELSDLEFPEDGCGLGDEDVTVKVNNYGSQTVNPFVLNYCAGGDTITDTVTIPVASGDSIWYTFSQPLHLAFTHDSTLNVRVWATAQSGDNFQSNDTVEAIVTSLLTPGMPDTIAMRQVQYASRDSITLIPPAGTVPIWYNYDMRPVDTSNTYVSDILYYGGVMGVRYMVVNGQEGSIGTAVTLNGKTAYPAPYQPNNSYAKQQYIYSAHDLAAAGLTAGKIYSIGFFLDSIYNISAGNPRDSVVFNNYYISMGLTTDTIFASTSAWKATNVVFHRQPMTIYRNQSKKWTRHDLDTPFIWDGISSLVVQVAHEVSPVVTNGVQSRYTTKANTTLYKAQNNALTPSLLEFNSTGTKGGNRPNLKFNTTLGCVGDMRTYEVEIVDVPVVDAAAAWPEGSDTIVYTSCDSISPMVSIRNQGDSAIAGMKFYYYLDNEAADSTVLNDTLLPGQVAELPVFHRQLMPGRHSLTVEVSVDEDNVFSNDVVSKCFMVRFCGGVYTIGADSTDNYSTLAEAVDSLSAVGIVGPVKFSIAPGRYHQQLTLSNVYGSSADNTLSFVGQNDSVWLTAAPTQNANYVMRITNASHVRLDSLVIASRPASGNYGHALVIQDCSDIQITNSNIRVKGSILNAGASCLTLLGNVTDLKMVGNELDSGYYSVYCNGAENSFANVTLTDNVFQGFASGGIYLRNGSNIHIDRNSLLSGNSANNRGIIGVWIANSSDSLYIQKNKIYLTDNSQGAKRGIVLEGAMGAILNQGMVVNNMISTNGTDSKNLFNINGKSASAGIVIDSASTYINVYFNTVRVYGTTAKNKGDVTYAFYCGNTTNYEPTHLQVMNNIFSNFSYGYSYYVGSPNSITTSNFNDYYTKAPSPFFWGLGQQDLGFLQNTNHDDGNSWFEEPYFVDSISDLHLSLTNLVGRAQYNTEVTDDIDGNIRPQVPTPTIGAHERSRLTHDMAVVRIHAPEMPANVNNSNNIEGDSVKVKATFFNNGKSNETNIRWYAYFLDTVYSNDTTILRVDSISSAIRSLGNFTPAQWKTDSLMMPTRMGIIYTHVAHVVLVADYDTTLNNNELTQSFYLAPAYNLKVSSIQVVNPTTNNACSMQRAQIQITLENKGKKPLLAGDSVKIGYHTEFSKKLNNSSYVFHQEFLRLPDTVEQMIVLENDLQVGYSTPPITFDSLANLYPVGNLCDMQVKINGWCNYRYDINPDNDTTTKINKDSYYTPAPPRAMLGNDTVDTVIFSYGTWGEIRAAHNQNKQIYWYRDSTSTEFYKGTNANTSRLWNNTPQYFHDSTYYLNCFNTHGSGANAVNCPSHFSSVTVHVEALKEYDVAVEDVLAPLGNRVFMEDDTVRVRVANYGINPRTNIPVTYRLKRGNQQIQEITDTVRVTLASMERYEFTFDTLLKITTPKTYQNYSLQIFTDLDSDEVRRNDTLRFWHAFHSNSDTCYYKTNNTKPTYSSAPNFDITRFSFNQIDVEMPVLGRGYTRWNDWDNREFPICHLSRGTQDSVIIQVTQFNREEQSFRCKAWVFIDYDRNGQFSDDEYVVEGASFYSNETFGSYITIPHTASYGTMLMRVVVCNYGVDYVPIEVKTSDKAHIMDFLLYVDEESTTRDIALTQIVSSRDPIIRNGNPRSVKFRMVNCGSEPLTATDIHYSFISDTIDSTDVGVVHWTGNLAAGCATVVSLPAHVFRVGTNHLTIWHETPGDTNTANDTLFREFHRSHVITLVMNDDFEGDDLWYAPIGYNRYGQNLWQRGAPNKVILDTAYSGVNVWATDLNSEVITGLNGTVSYLYSPIIDISQIRADTISFRLKRNLINGSTLHVEFYNFANTWVKLNHDSVINNWYTDIENGVFDGNTPNTENYTRYYFPGSRLSGDFQERLQFRLVYTAPLGTNDRSAYGEGCAVDDFCVGRARRAVDVGVVAITQPTAPKYGQTIYPEVVVKNYGTDTIRSFTLGYTHYGTYLAKEAVVNATIGPNDVDTIEVPTPFIITSDFPDTFYINAFTSHGLDIYYDNDTVTQSFLLSPLDNDVCAEAILNPRDYVIAGDTGVLVTLRIRNFGQTPLARATASYMVNGTNRVDEEVDFVALQGDSLLTGHYFNYDFHHRLHAPMGLIRLTAFVNSDSNEYIYNDTVNKRIEGITSVTDLSAKSVIVDTSSFSSVRIAMVIENLGARGTNGFEVGYWIDNDTSTIVRETYWRNLPIPALSTGYYLFETELPTRPAPYNHVTAYVKIANDNNPTNDTTNIQSEQFTDIEVMKLVVEENATDTCRVFMKLRNIGNLALVDRQLRLRATINGQDLSLNVRRRVDAGRSITIQFDTVIPKSPTRHYEGSGKILAVSGDVNNTNDQTTLIEVVNYVEGIPAVNADAFVLDQNYPNPFSHQTTIPFTLPNAANVRFFIMDAMGHIAHSHERFYQAGSHDLVIDMADYSSGIYFYGLEVDGQRQMRKMILK